MQELTFSSRSFNEPASRALHLSRHAQYQSFRQYKQTRVISDPSYGNVTVQGRRVADAFKSPRLNTHSIGNEILKMHIRYFTIHLVKVYYIARHLPVVIVSCNFY